MNRKLNPAERAELAEQYRIGTSALDLARQFPHEGPYRNRSAARCHASPPQMSGFSAPAADTPQTASSLYRNEP